MNTNRTAAILVGMAAASLVALSAAEAANVIRKTNGQLVEGKKITWRELTREYQVEMGDGIVVPVAKADVESIEVDKPADMGKAVQLMAAKKYDEAIPILDDIATRYKMLQWDGAAREMLARAYCAKNDFKKGVQMLEDYFASTPKEQAPDTVRDMYWTALLGAQRGATLKVELEAALKAGSKTLMPLALMRRGDLSASEGRREDAFLDYMRVALIHQEAGASVAEALSKAAQLLDAMNDRRADELRKRMAAQFPGSPYARPRGDQ